MKFLLISAAVLVGTASAAQAQQAPANPAPAPAAAAAPLNGDTPIETLIASPAAKPLVLKYFPDLETHPAYEQFKGMSLRALAPYSDGGITEEKIVALEADLKAAK